MNTGTIYSQLPSKSRLKSVVGKNSVAPTSTSSMSTISDVIHFSLLPKAFRPRARISAAGMKNRMLPMRLSMPNKECIKSPLPLIYAISAPSALTVTEANISHEPNPPT